MFTTRLISSVILVVLTLFTVITGGNVLLATVLFISLIGLRELYRVIHIENTVLGYAGYAFTLAYAALMYFDLHDSMKICVLFLIVVMSLYVFNFPKYRAEQVFWSYFGVFYVTIMLFHIYQVRMLQDGIIVVWLIFLGAWGSDTCAYCVGMLIGKHKMAPKLSPKKSIEGGIGGVVGAALLGMLFAVIFKTRIKGLENPVLIYGVICGAASIISQIGDLAASAIKRNYEIKDYGKLIPGHGGILDRFDSIIFTAPIVYYLAEILH